MIFGKAGGFGTNLALSALDGSNGFRIDGMASVDPSIYAISALSAVSGAGDINGDGFADLIIGANVNEGFAGASYVLFGKAEGFGANISLTELDGSNGFRLTGVSAYDQSGAAVSGAGDVNGDGYDDLLIAAYDAAGHAGVSYLVFGKASGFDASVSLAALDGSNGFSLVGAANDRAGKSVNAAGDVNGDGYDDLIVSSANAGGNAGASYVVFGRDFTHAVAHEGGSGDDALNGNADNESLVGGRGNDVLTGGAGRDVLLGGAGDDILIWDANDWRVDGGGGRDTVVVDGKLTFSAGEFRLRDIEMLDLRGGSAGSVVLDALAVRAMTSSPHRLTVLGDGNDFVNLTGSWTTVDGAAAGFARYAAGAISVDVQSGVPLLVAGAMSLGGLTGSNGFRFAGVTPFGQFGAVPGDQAGRALSLAGDVNGDGLDDLIIGAFQATDRAGANYVVFGKPGGFDPNMSLADLDGANGFTLNGGNASDRSGRAVSGGGDVNGDGYTDLLIGAMGVNGYAGASYVVFGHAGSFASSLNLANLEVSNGFRLEGANPVDASGNALSTAGDVNGDGYDDVIVGAYLAGGTAGASYVVFGKKDGFEQSLGLATLDGHNGFRFDGGSSGDRIGYAVGAAGDINSDGYDDLIVSAPFAQGSAGAAYVVYGKLGGFDASLNLNTLGAANGFRIEPATATDILGAAVGAAGDLNHDGFADFFVSSPLVANSAGATYVIYGKAEGFGTSLNLATLNGANGFRIVGASAFDTSGSAVSAAGDVNGDGYADLLVATPWAAGQKGESYVLFGAEAGFAADINLATLNGTNGLRITGALNGIGGQPERSGNAVSGAGDVNGDGYDDIFIGAPFADGNAGAGYTVFGRDFSNAVAAEGGSGDDILHGTAQHESLIGGRGNDVLDGAAGQDVLLGGAGNDVLVWDAADRRVDGGGGVDTLRIDGAGIALDLSLVRQDLVTGIERIDLCGSGNNTLSLDIDDVLALPDLADAFVDASTRQLLVDGDSGDVVHSVAQGWIQGADVSVNGTLYASYTHAGIAAELLIAPEVTRDVS